MASKATDSSASLLPPIASAQPATAGSGTTETSLALNRQRVSSVNAVVGPPLDFSFKELSKIADLIGEEPRNGTVKKKKKGGAGTSGALDATPAAPAALIATDGDSSGRADDGGGGGSGGGGGDSSGATAASGSTAATATVAADGADSSAKRGPRSPRKVVRTLALRLNNNNFADITDLKATVGELLNEPNEVNWIDLSFNKIAKIDKIFLDFPKLGVLYMHANNIERLSQLDCLAKLTNLKSLTLHGNPIENLKGYRQYVISTLPNLRQLDFCAVTKQDKAVAKSWREMYGKKKGATAS